MLCSVIAARDVEPPLSIGLFGDWGTGKTFFMKQMEAWINRMKAQARARDATAAPSAYCTNVVQLWFNAWHYIDANLWASLTAEIFDGLGRALREEAALTQGVDDPARARDRLMTAAASARDVLAEAERRKSAAEADTRAMQERLDFAGGQRVESRGQPGQRRGRRGARAAGGQEEAGTGRQGAGRPRAARVFQGAAVAGAAAPRRRRHIARAVDGGATAPLADRGAGRAGVGRRRRDLEGAVVVSAETISQRGRDALRRRHHVPDHADRPYLPRVLRAKKLVDDTLKKLAAAEAARRSELEQQQASVRQQMEVTERRLGEARAAVGELERQLAELRADTRMSEFVTARRESTDYTQHLGVVARARRDFERLSDLLEQVRRQGAESADAAQLPRIDRIVLYIDDLDRCPEERSSRCCRRFICCWPSRCSSSWSASTAAGSCIRSSEAPASFATSTRRETRCPRRNGFTGARPRSTIWRRSSDPLLAAPDGAWRLRAADPEPGSCRAAGRRGSGRAA